MTASTSHKPFNKTAKGSHNPTAKKKRSGQRRKDGRLNTEIPARSHLMQIAKLNSTNSPLLRLPGEIRNKIWAYTLGGNRVNVYDINTAAPYGPAIGKGKVTGDWLASAGGHLVPKFSLPLVCRQLYVESAALLYTHNTFTFDSFYTFDAWIKARTLHQRRHVASVDIPLQYMKLYFADKRKLLHRTFPNLRRASIHSQLAYIHAGLSCDSSLDDGAKQLLALAREAVADAVAEKEGGRGPYVCWHS